MSSSHIDIETQRQWMYNRFNPQTGCLTEDFERGCDDFIAFATNAQHDEVDMIWCPCKKCKNERRISVQRLRSHLFLHGFTPNYSVWTAHGEQIQHPPLYGGVRSTEEQTYGHPYADPPRFETSGQQEDGETDSYDQVMVDTPDTETTAFFNALTSAKQPLYDNCAEGLSKFSCASDMMCCKTKNNASEETFNDFARVLKHNLPSGNLAPRNYYETERVMKDLSLPYYSIDVCQNNCMIYWSEADKYLLECKFCGAPRHRPEKKKSRRAPNKAKRVPYKKMWYLPITDRLRRLYLAPKTAPHMRWHAEHNHTDGRMEHPSDGKAWKHFNTLYPDFASSSRNVYMGLCTDGFNPFGMSGANYSLWPVILTPYNLPPEMCMKKEFLFLSILIPGPDHPKRSLDIFLQPLIHELKGLWDVGVDAFDISNKERFNMRAVLMWTISDFPAYAMLSGWTTHGRLACPYCMNESDAFYLGHGRKNCWFDCHRRFLPASHAYRQDEQAFTRETTMDKGPPELLQGTDILEKHLDAIYGLLETTDCGGNGHINAAIDGYLESHNWHKRSIFWKLPYWETHLLRHNLDVMHIEKNFFDNIFNTIFNVPGRSKDTINSRKDLMLICDRPTLHLTSMGRAPVPVFRMFSPGKAAFLKWLKNEVKFPDGYASNIGRCVNEQTQKVYGLKSHDCHVLMQRILPFAFAELMSPAVHDAISDLALFFRDICARCITSDDVDRLKANISLTICNLEKIFPPSFFDVMEHLVVHLPEEAALGGPVQFRWMYPPERYMFHLKKKGKNKANVEGSIVKAYILEEIATFTSQFIQIRGTIMHSVPKKRHYIGYLQLTTYDYNVPEIFRHVGSGIGRSYNVRLTDEDKHIAHTYILLNCPEMSGYERIYDDLMRHYYPTITAYELASYKRQGFAKWLAEFVLYDCSNRSHPLWLIELARGPIRTCTCWNKYFSRGYNFHTLDYGRDRSTANYGVVVRGNGSGDDAYYGQLTEIIQIAYHGAVGLKVTLFRCDWFDPTPGTGVRKRKPGVVEVFKNGRYAMYDPFILTTQADQVCFLAYPRTRVVRDEWLVAIKIRPRGIVDDATIQFGAVQEDDNDYGLPFVVGNLHVNSHVIPGGGLEVIPEDPIRNEDGDYDTDVPLSDSSSSSDSDSDYEG